MSRHSQIPPKLLAIMSVGMYGFIAYQACAAPADLMNFGAFSLQLGVMKKIIILNSGGQYSLNVWYSNGDITNTNNPPASTPDPLDSASVAALRKYLQGVWLEFPHKSNYGTNDTTDTEYFINPAFVNITICENTMRGGVSGVDVVDIKDGLIGAVTLSSAKLACP